MPIGDLVYDAVNIILVVAVLLIAYRALRLRSVLIDRPYRTRAFGTAIGALTIVAFLAAAYTDGIFGQTPTTAEGVLVEAAAWGFTFIGLLVWVVTNNNVAVSADYFNRDVLYWRSGGKWVTIVGVLILYGFASLPPWWVPSQLESALVGNIFNLIFAVAVIYAGLVLAITVLRTKDRSIRNLTKWVLISTALMWAFILTGAPGLSLVTLLSGLLLVAYIYAMNHTVSVLAIRTKALPA